MWLPINVRGRSKCLRAAKSDRFSVLKKARHVAVTIRALILAFVASFAFGVVSNYAYDGHFTLAAESRLAMLQSRFEALADAHLLPKYLELDPELEAGYTGSFSTGIVGNARKATFGQPVDLSNFDIDYWIKSDTLYEKFGPNLRADVEFRKILSETPGFEGLRPNKAGFSIRFMPSSD